LTALNIPIQNGGGVGARQENHLVIEDRRVPTFTENYSLDAVDAIDEMWSSLIQSSTSRFMSAI